MTENSDRTAMLRDVRAGRLTVDGAIKALNGGSQPAGAPPAADLTRRLEIWLSTVLADEELFFGVDSLGHLERFLRGEDPLSREERERLRTLPMAASRR